MAGEDERWSRTITVEQAFKAVQELIYIYWQTGGEAEDQIAAFGSAVGGDPALEDDWLLAVDKALA